MSASALKSSRMEFKTTQEVKALLTSAAGLTGLDLTSFVLEPALARAQQVIADSSRLQLTLAQQKQFCALLATPLAPSPALRTLMQGERLVTR